MNGKPTPNQILVLEEMVHFTARLVRLENNQPRDGGSGILVHIEEKLFLFSVLHIFKDKGWYIETEVTTDGSTLLIKLGKMNWFVKRPIVKKNRSSCDGFAWLELDKASIKNILLKEQIKLNTEISLPIYYGPINSLPSKSEVYRFGTNLMRSLIKHPNLNELVRETVIELDMKYVSTDSRGYYCFKLNRKHKGHKFYYGASGSPILDSKGAIVALVQGGCKKDNIIYGIPLDNFVAKAVKNQYA